MGRTHTHTHTHNTIQYNYITKCQHNCTRNVLWCQVHSSHIHTNPKTSLDYNTCTHIHIYTHTHTHNTIQYNCITKCQHNCTRNVLWCQVHSSHIHTNPKTSLDYNTRTHIHMYIHTHTCNGHMPHHTH